MDSEEVTFLSSWVLTITRMLAAQGLNVSEVLEKADIDSALLAQPGARIRRGSVRKLWQIAVQLTGRKDIGLEMAKHVTSNTTYTLELAMHSAQTPRDAIMTAQRFPIVVDTSGAYDIEETEDEFILSWCYRENDYQPCFEASDAAFAVAFKILKELFRDIDGIYKSVEFMREQPKDPSSYYDLFPCKVSFGHNKLCWRFDLAAMDQPLATANPASKRVAEELLGEYMATLTDENVVYRARHAITELLKAGAVSRKLVANHLGMSERNLNYQLANTGVSFKDLFEQERKQYAIALLTEGQSNITAITYRLGFKDVSSFSRAFKRWTGKSPLMFTTAKLEQRQAQSATAV